MDFGNCHLCGYAAQSEAEVQAWFNYGCARAKVNKGEYTLSVETCAEDGIGGFYAPGTKPNTQVEDPDAFKENYIKKLEADKKLRERKPKKREDSNS